MADLAGVAVSAGFMAGVRGKAAARLEPFMTRVRELLHAAGVLHADETPARAAGRLQYLHVACTGHLTAMHAGGRSAADIDAGGVLSGYTGVLVRDGYGGYSHLTDALHAWCGAHSLRDLRDLYTADPAGQAWAQEMARVLTWANTAAAAARHAGKPQLARRQLTKIRDWYDAAVNNGIHDNTARTSQLARDGLRLARRFAASQDMILRFTTDLAIGFTNNQAERDIRPVKIQQRTSGGCWRTLQGLTDFAVVQSYLSTAAKWDIPNSTPSPSSSPPAPGYPPPPHPPDPR
jgi:transposase